MKWLIVFNDDQISRISEVWKFFSLKKSQIYRNPINI